MNKIIIYNMTFQFLCLVLLYKVVYKSTNHFRYFFHHTISSEYGQVLYYKCAETNNILADLCALGLFVKKKKTRTEVDSFDVLK